MDAVGLDLADSPIAGKTIPFLDLPAHYNLWVHDILHFNFSDPPNSKYPLADFTTSAGILLVSKVIDGLRHWGGYSDDDISKVGGLVERNLETCHSVQVRGEVDKFILSMGNKPVDIPRLTVDFMLRGFFDPNVTRDGGLSINSNEPVLLINFDDNEGSGRLDAAKRDMLNYIVNIAVADLQHKWNILPVRVNAGAFLPLVPGGAGEDEGKEGAVPGFSITLLNVVNTDIGGPSMPQLLDADCDAPEWHRILRREVWRGRELVSHEDSAGVGPGMYDASERSLESEGEDGESVGSDALNLASLGDPLQTGSDLQDEKPAAEKPFPEIGGNDRQQEVPTTDDTQESDKQPPVQHEDLAAEVRENRGQGLAEAGAQEHLVEEDDELPMKNVEHPTWERHDDSTSLLDLIRSQVSRVAPFGTETEGHGVADVESMVAGSAGSKADSARSSEKVDPASVAEEVPQAKSSSEDDFVVV